MQRSTSLLLLLIIIPLIYSCQKEIVEKNVLTIIFNGNYHNDIENNSSVSISRTASIIDDLLTENKNLLIFDSGNLFFRLNSDSSSDKSEMEAKANSILKLFNEMEITAINLGLTDLNLGEEFLLSLKESANFVFISSNIFSTVTGKPLFFQFHVRKIAGLRVGIFGLTSDTGNYPSSIDIRDPLKTASLMVNVLSKVADLTVGLSNMPLEMNIALADSVKDIDLIIGQYNGKISSNPIIVNGTPIYMTGKGDRDLGIIELSLSNMNLGLTDITNKKTEAPNSASFKLIDLSKEVSLSKK